MSKQNASFLLVRLAHTELSQYTLGPGIKMFPEDVSFLGNIVLMLSLLP